MGNRVSSKWNRKRLVIAIFLLLIPNLLFSFELEILPEQPTVGRVITLKIITDIPQDSDIQVDDLELPYDIKEIAGPVVRTYRVLEDRRYKRYYQVTWALRVDKSGIYSIPKFNVVVNGKDNELEFPTLIVLNNDERFNNYPINVEWNRSVKKEIYVGESIPLILEAYNLEEIYFPDRKVHIYPEKGEVAEVSGLGDIHPETVAGIDLYRVPMASWIYTPLEVGNVYIPPVRVEINGLIRFTEALDITVLPIPEINTTRGVGEFIITSELSVDQVTPDDTFHYKVRVSGQGNLPYFEIPKVNFSGLILIDKSEDENVDSGAQGFLGWREVDYTLQALEIGVKEISLPSVSWIDKSGIEIFFNGQVSHMNVVSVKVVEEDILPYLSLMNSSDIISSYRFFMYRNPYAWLLLLFSVIITIIISIVKVVSRRYRQKLLIISMAVLPLALFSFTFAKGIEFQSEFQKADKFIETEEYLNALNIYSKLKEELPRNYGLYVNSAILWDKLDNISQAVLNIRIAERIVPTSLKVSQIKHYLSETDEYDLKQAKTASPINPDYLFLLFILFFNIVVIMTIRIKKYRGITTVSLFFISLLLTIVAGLSLYFIDSKDRVSAGIISTGGAELTKVPSDKALEWISLGEGYCVYIKGEWKDQYLIETEYGLGGWLQKDALLVLEDR